MQTFVFSAVTYAGESTRALAGGVGGGGEKVSRTPSADALFMSRATWKGEACYGAKVGAGSHQSDFL